MFTSSQLPLATVRLGMSLFLNFVVFAFFAAFVVKAGVCGTLQGVPTPFCRKS